MAPGPALKTKEPEASTPPLATRERLRLGNGCRGLKPGSSIPDRWRLSRCDDPDRVQRSVPARLPKAPEGLDGFVAPLDAAPAGRSATGATLHPGPNIYGYRTHAESAHGSHPEAMRRGAQIPGAFQIGPWGTPHFQFP